MEVYLDDRKLEEFNDLDREDIIAKLEKKIEDKIITKVYLGKSEFSLAEFKESGINLKGISSDLRFITKDTDQLIEETLKTAKDYLPKLKQGLNDTIALFKQGKLNEAHQKYGLCLDGLEWYTKAVFKIISLTKHEKITEVESLLKEFNKRINNSAVAYQHGDLNNVVKIIQEELLETVEEFISLNEKILNKSKE